MAKNYIKPDHDKLFNRRMRAALASILHTQTAVKAVLDQAEGFMAEKELACSCIYGLLCHYDAQTGRVFKALCQDLSDGTPTAGEKSDEGTERIQAKSLPSVVSSKVLLQVMGRKNYRKLVSICKLNILKAGAPGVHALIATDSIPTRYRQALEDLYRTGGVSDTLSEGQSI